MVELRPIERADAAEVTRMLSRAFADDPFLNWFLRTDDGHAAGSDLFFEVALELSLPHGLACMTPDGGGAALWFPPDKWQMGFWSLLRMAPRMAKATSWRRLLGVARKLDRVLKVHPHAPHRYLYVLGVDPAQQGRGVGAALLGPALTACDAQGIGAYLETSKERNLGFYQKHGFRVRDEVVLSAACTVWTMWREPIR